MASPNKIIATQIIDKGTGVSKDVSALVNSTDFDPAKLSQTASYVSGTKILTINLLYDGVQQSTVDVNLT